MEPSLHPGSLFLFRQCQERERALQAGDVVLLRREGETWIKRVYATAGTCFWALRDRDGGRLYSRPIREDQRARFEGIARFQRAQGRDCTVVRMRVPPGKLFVMGDALSSRDSRELGPVLESEVVGKVVTALPGGLAGMPETAELAFPTRSTFVRLGNAVPPAVAKRETPQRRALAVRRDGTRARSVDAPRPQITSAA